jgi:hypothetical protein
LISIAAGAAGQTLVWTDRPGQDDLCVGSADSGRMSAVAIRFKSGRPT